MLEKIALLETMKKNERAISLVCKEITGNKQTPKRFNFLRKGILSF